MAAFSAERSINFMAFFFAKVWEVHHQTNEMASSPRMKWQVLGIQNLETFLLME